MNGLLKKWKKMMIGKRKIPFLCSILPDLRNKVNQHKSVSIRIQAVKSIPTANYWKLSIPKMMVCLVLRQLRTSSITMKHATPELKSLIIKQLKNTSSKPTGVCIWYRMSVCIYPADYA